MATLYELTGNYQKLLEFAAGSDPDTFDDALKALEDIEDEIENKADGYGKVLCSIAADIATIQAEITRLTNRKTALENSAKKIRDRLKDAMEATGMRRIKTATFSFWIQKNPPVVQIKDEKKIPEQFWKEQNPVLDNTELKKYLKENGNQEYAELVQATSLRIK